MNFHGRLTLLALLLMAASFLIAMAAESSISAQNSDSDFAPSNLAVALVDNQVTLTWDAPAQDAASVTGYEILRRRPNAGEDSLGTLVDDTESTDTTYVDATANVAGVRYVYGIMALRNGVKSVLSNDATIDLPECSETSTAITNISTRILGTTPDLTGLVADCNTLLGLEGELTGTGPGAGSLNWTAETAMDTWDGITVAGFPPRVTRLDLVGKSLTGTIPEEMKDLSQLTKLVLRNNRLTGTIPPSLGHLTKLTTLWISSNQLTGPIPSEWGDPTGPSPLTALTELRIDSNQLTGSIPSALGSLESLNNLSLGENQLTGGIPKELGNLTNLHELVLDSNQLTGGIPKELGNFAYMTILALQYNGLTGAIPTELGNLTRLWSLTLYSNQLTGPIPSELGNLTRAVFLYLDSNNLSGEIPEELGNLTAIHEITLNGNPLTGPIPAELSAPVQLTRLWLHDTEWTGTIPAELVARTEQDSFTMDLRTNRRPVAPAVRDQNLRGGDEFTYQVVFSDPDGDTLTYIAKQAGDAPENDTPLPSWLTIDPATGILSGTPPENETVRVRVTAEDSPADSSPSLRASVTFTVSSHPVANTPSPPPPPPPAAPPPSGGGGSADQPGAVTLSSDQPQVGMELTATLTDPDDGIEDKAWLWQRSADQDTWTAIDGADSSSYTPVEADVGHYLKVTATYTDFLGEGKTAAAVTTASVDRPGTVTLPSDQPQVGMELTATLTDLGEGIEDVTWLWEGSADQVTWIAIEGADSASYTPVGSDVDRYLKVTATYTDSLGEGKTAEAVTKATVAAAGEEPEPPPTPADPCATALGTLTSGIARPGAWNDDCDSVNRDGSYAHFYSFTLLENTEVAIDLTSDEDAYLFLLQGTGTDGTVEEENDDIETGNTDSQIVATLEAGSYTIEATTYDASTTGDFTLTITGPGDGCSVDLRALTGTTVLTGTWAEGCLSTNRDGSYARFYTFTLAEETGITIDLTSDEDAYLFLLEGTGTVGTVEEENDDIESGNTDSQIVATLSAGAYTIEATTYYVATTGEFTLSIARSESGCSVDLGVLTGKVTLTGTWPEGCPSTNRDGSYARFYTFTLAEETEITIDLTSDEDPCLFLLQGTGTVGTVEEENDDIESGNTDSQIVTTLEAGNYTIEVTAYYAATTGEFTLEVSG